jgi:hypothetical protein
MFDARKSESEFIRVCGLTLIKSRNYSMGLYSLILDGLGQEAGAMLRPIIETYELLVYFRLDPSRVRQATDDKLPSAGNVGKKISGRFQKLRTYLNKHASHFAFSFDSMKHVLNFSNFDWNISQEYSEHALKTNMGVLFGMLINIIFEGINCLSVGDSSVINEIGDDIEQFRAKGLDFFSQP